MNWCVQQDEKYKYILIIAASMREKYFRYLPNINISNPI